MTNSQYKSPAHKLINFFKNSRDKWKAKVTQAQKKIRSLTEMLCTLRQRRDELKVQVKELRQQVLQLEKELQQTKVHDQKKKRQPVKQRSDKKQSTENSSRSLVPANSYQILDYYNFNENEMVPANHHYDARTIGMASELVITACSSFHSVGKSLEVIKKYLPVETPSADSVRQWIYRLGYYELVKKPKPFRSDWIFIADFTATVGMCKCFVVIGITEVQLKKCKFRLRHQDMTLLGLEIWEHSTGEKINECFENISRQVGVPLQIVIDGGSDINKGTKLFCEQHRKTKQFSDLSHKLARLLEKHLKDDEEWNLFVNSVSVAKAQSQQTALACLTPPARRTQARYMNLHTMTRWAIRMLKYKSRENFEVLGMGFGLDEQRALALEHKIETELAQLESNQIEEIEIHCLVERLRGLVTENPEQTCSQFREKLVKILKPDEQKHLEQIILKGADIGRAKFENTFGWLEEQNTAISLYSTLLQMVEAVEIEIKTKGLNRKSVASSQKSLIALGQCELEPSFCQ